MLVLPASESYGIGGMLGQERVSKIKNCIYLSITELN